MIVKFLRWFAPTRKLIYKLGEDRADIYINEFKDDLIAGPLLDVGAGMGNIVVHLRDLGYDVTPLDVENLSFTPKVTPQLYDGQRMPFDDKHFDAALILTVLHHVKDPDALIRESMRVARRVIIIEDVFENNFHKYVTYFVDSLLNLEFFGHPHSNRSDQEWRSTFKKLGLKLIKTSTMNSFLVMRHRVYVLDTPH